MLELRTQLQQCFQGRVCLMGLGNVDGGDDGFGVRLAEALTGLAPETSDAPSEREGFSLCSSPRPSPPEEESEEHRARELDFRVLVAGTTPERFIGRVTEAGFDHLIFLDAVEFSGAPGAVAFLNAEEMTSRFPQVSTHKLSLGLLAKWVESGGKTKVWLLGAQPESLRPGAALSPSAQGALELLTQLLHGVFSPSHPREERVGERRLLSPAPIPVHEEGFPSATRPTILSVC
jgi:hydrogenase maturation protease